MQLAGNVAVQAKKLTTGKMTKVRVARKKNRSRKLNFEYSMMQRVVLNRIGLF